MNSNQEDRRQEYLEKLKDPRWQKKRLEIFKRDKWTCQICYDTESTLHVHHRLYFKNNEPWDYPNEALVTLCEECHEEERRTRSDDEQTLIQALRYKFMSADINSLAKGFQNLSLVHAPEIVSSALQWALENRDMQAEIVNRYFEHLKAKKDAHEARQTKQSPTRPPMQRDTVHGG